MTRNDPPIQPGIHEDEDYRSGVALVAFLIVGILGLAGMFILDMFVPQNVDKSDLSVWLAPFFIFGFFFGALPGYLLGNSLPGAPYNVHARQMKKYQQDQE